MGQSFTNGFSGPKTFRDFGETGLWPQLAHTPSVPRISSYLSCLVKRPLLISFWSLQGKNAWNVAANGGCWWLPEVNYSKKVLDRFIFLTFSDCLAVYGVVFCFKCLQVGICLLMQSKTFQPSKLLHLRWITWSWETVHLGGWAVPGVTSRNIHDAGAGKTTSS